MRLSAQQVNGEMLSLEVTPEMGGRELKQQIKEMAGRTWDEATRSTTVVEIVVGDRLLGNDETVADAGLAADAAMSVVFKTNAVRCCDLNGLISLLDEIDTELLLVVEIPNHETRIANRGFRRL